MVIKVQRFRTWKDLLKEADRLVKLGYICAVKGWEDIRTNTLTVSTQE